MTHHSYDQQDVQAPATTGSWLLAAVTALLALLIAGVLPRILM